MTTAPFTLDASRAALLVVDLQNDFVRAGAPQEVASARATLERVGALREAVRGASRTVVFTRYTAGPDVTHHAWFSPECRPPHCSCWPGVERVYDDRRSALAGHDVVDELSPMPDEVIVDKYGYGSFHNTVLDDVLCAANVTQVWVVGTVTQICVEETVREGYRRGYQMVVAADGVSSFDDELHRATLRNLAQKFALVCDTATMRDALARHADAGGRHG